MRPLTKPETDAINSWIYFGEVETLNFEDKEYQSLFNFSETRSFVDLSGKQMQALQSLKRNDFDSELYWKQNTGCSGPIVSNKYDCHLRSDEMVLLMYTPYPCISGEVPQCAELVSYVRIGIKETS